MNRTGFPAWIKSILALLALWLPASLAAAGQSVHPWGNDFRLQPIEQRPGLEVRYTNAEREAFEILAEEYHVVGQLRKPHLLRDARSDELWLKL